VLDNNLLAITRGVVDGLDRAIARGIYVGAGGDRKVNPSVKAGLAGYWIGSKAEGGGKEVIRDWRPKWEVRDHPCVPCDLFEACRPGKRICHTMIGRWIRRGDRGVLGNEDKKGKDGEGNKDERLDASPGGVETRNNLQKRNEGKCEESEDADTERNLR
jgi:hypothetical protein